MFSEDHKIDTMQELIQEFKRYVELQKEYTKLEITEKLSVLLSTLILLLLIITLGMVALFYASFMFAYILEPWVGGLMNSFAIITVIHLFLIALVIIFRKRWIINPMVSFVAGLFLDHSK